MCMCPLCANFIYFSSSFCFREQSLPGSAMCPSLVLPRVFFLFVHGLTPCFITCRLLVQPHVLSWFCHVFVSLLVHVSFSCWPTCYLQVHPRSIFVFAHAFFIWSPTRHLSACQFTICTRDRFFLDHVFVSCSPECPIRTTTCPNPRWYTCPYLTCRLIIRELHKETQYSDG